MEAHALVLYSEFLTPPLLYLTVGGLVGLAYRWARTIRAKRVGGKGSPAFGQSLAELNSRDRRYILMLIGLGAFGLVFDLAAILWVIGVGAGLSILILEEILPLLWKIVSYPRYPRWLNTDNVNKFGELVVILFAGGSLLLFGFVLVSGLLEHPLLMLISLLTMLAAPVGLYLLVRYLVVPLLNFLFRMPSEVNAAEQGAGSDAKTAERWGEEAAARVQ